MAAVTAAVNLSLGLLSCTVAVHSAIETEAGNVNVCTGTGEAEHDAVRVYQSTNCRTCGPMQPTDIRKARQTPEGLVLLTEDDLAKVKQEPEKFKKKMELTPHPAEPLQRETFPGEKAYHLVPHAGHADVYATLVRLVAAHPELAFVTRWTPRSQVMVLHLTSDGEVLLARERIQGDRIKATPDIRPAEAGKVEQLYPMAETVLGLPGVVQPFDLERYRDTSQEVLAEIISGRTAVPDVKVTASAALPTSAVDGLAALQAMIDAAQPAKPAPRRRAAKKTAAPAKVA